MGKTTRSSVVMVLVMTPIYARLELMATETFVVQSALSPEDAFVRVVDLLRVSEWDPGVRSPRLIGGEPGCVGASYEVSVMGFDGGPTTATYELTAVDAPRSFTMVGSHPDFRADDTVTVEPAANGCRVTYDAGLVLLGDRPPLSEAQLDEAFTAIVAVPQKGLTSFLNP